MKYGLRWTLVLILAPSWAMCNEKKDPQPLDLKAIGTAAIVDLSKSPVGALFEAKVLNDVKLTWVERAQVEKVVAELEAQALFTPEGGSKRAGLGKLLKAD